ncbi:hypothetical protein ACJBU6_06664 [Exserohilum turcicum]
MPRYAFRIDEICESDQVAPTVTTGRGDWIPSVQHGANNSVPHNVGSQNVSYRWWVFDGTQIRESPVKPPNTQPYQTYSVFYNGGFGFWVLKDDATNPRREAAWQPLCFEHNLQDGSSYLCDSAQHRTVACRKHGQHWLQMLLPDIHYRGVPFVHSQALGGGLKGDLALFLALVALAAEPTQLPNVLPRICVNGTWQQQLGVGVSDGWLSKRGVVVYVHTYPPWTSADLRRYERSYTYFR